LPKRKTKNDKNFQLKKKKKEKKNGGPRGCQKNNLVVKTMVQEKFIFSYQKKLRPF